MAEYPPRSCGPCPNSPSSGQQEQPKDYLSKNTVPQPQIAFKKGEKPIDSSLGVAHSVIAPNLSIQPIVNKEVLGEYMMDPETGVNLNVAPPLESLPGADPLQRGLICSGSEAVVEKPQKLTLKGILKKEEGPSTVEGMYATVGRNVPHSPPTSDHRQEPNNQSLPCYLPQPSDSLPHPLEKAMSPIGPWATGRVDWGSLAGLTGTRPVVDKYSITRYSEGDWRAHNKKALSENELEQHRANLINWNGRQCLEQIFGSVNKNQEDNTKRLQQRELELHRWKCEAERAIAAGSEEIGFMQDQRHRLKEAVKELTLAESIAGECLERRTGRINGELVRDEVEEELIKEVALCAEIREIFARTLKDVEAQLLEDKTAKERLEYDWSDKKVAHELESINMALHNQSNTVLFKPGAVGFPAEQSSQEFWEHFTRETVVEGESTRQRSVTFRSTLDNIITNAARDLRCQADKVESALSKRIACTQEVTRKLEDDLKIILQRLADVEDLKEQLRLALRRLDTPVRINQTRLDNRMRRPRVENCRDNVHFALVDEAKTLGEATAALTAQMNQAEDSQNKLIQARSDVEREIINKRKTLEIDLERSGRIRSFYPSTTALTGQ